MAVICVKVLSMGRRRKLAERVMTVTLPKGTELIRQGHYSSTQLVLIDGACRLVEGTGAAKTQLKEIAGTCSFGEQAIFGPVPAAYSVVTCQTSKLLAIELTDIFSVIKESDAC